MFQKFFLCLFAAALLLSPGIAPAAADTTPSPSQAAANEVGTPIVIGRSFLVRSDILKDERRINVYLPDDYEKPGLRFPVLYLLDGGAKEDFLHIAGLAQIISAYGNGKELIVVGIEGVDRHRDLTSPSDITSDLKLLPTSGGADSYRSFLVRELKPWVEAHYRTDGHSALIGESLAGLFTLETFLRSPQDFDDYIAVSPSLWWQGGAVSRDIAALLKAQNFAGQRIFIAFDDPAPPPELAEKDRALQDRVSAAFYTANPAGLTWRIARPGEGHATIYHPSAQMALRWLYGSKLP